MWSQMEDHKGNKNQNWTHSKAVQSQMHEDCPVVKDHGDSAWW